MKSGHREVAIATGLVVLTVLTRFLPHAPNFSPVLALCLFAGSVLDRKWAFGLTLGAILMSDLALGFYEGISFVYLAYILSLGLGMTIKNRRILPVAVAAFVASSIFFLLSNLGVWLFAGIYEKSAAGLTQCFVMALPFFQSTLSSTLMGAVVLFGVYHLTEKRMQALAVEK